MQRLEQGTICFLASNLQFEEYPAALQILGLSNAATKSQGLCCLLLPFPCHSSRYAAGITRAAPEQPCTNNHLLPGKLPQPPVRAQGKPSGQNKGLNTRPDRESQANLLLTHTAGLSIIICNEPTNMPHGHNLIKGLQFRRVSGQFSMIATRALP